MKIPPLSPQKEILPQSLSSPQMKIPLSSPQKMSMRKALNRWADVWVQRHSLRRAVTALVFSGLRTGFTTWADAAEQSARARESMVQVAQTLRHRGVRKAFAAWHAAACESAEQQRLLRSAVSAFTSGGLVHAWNSCGL